VVLRLAIEAAGSLSSADVLEAMRAMDEETFFGRVRFGHDGSNVALEAPVVQVTDFFSFLWASGVRVCRVSGFGFPFRVSG
jgi:hypothetical protein